MSQKFISMLLVHCWNRLYRTRSPYWNLCSGTSPNFNTISLELWSPGTGWSRRWWDSCPCCTPGQGHAVWLAQGLRRVGTRGSRVLVKQTLPNLKNVYPWWKYVHGQALQWLWVLFCFVLLPSSTCILGQCSCKVGPNRSHYHLCKSFVNYVLAQQI